MTQINGYTITHRAPSTSLGYDVIMGQQTRPSTGLVFATATIPTDVMAVHEDPPTFWDSGTYFDHGTEDERYRAAFSNWLERVADPRPPVQPQLSEDMLARLAVVFEDAAYYRIDDGITDETDPTDVEQYSKAEAVRLELGIPDHAVSTGVLVTDENGVVYTPHVSGPVVGVMATHPDGRVQFVLLNPSTDDSAGQSNVFLYQGDDDQLDSIEPVVHVVLFNEPEST